MNMIELQDRLKNFSQEQLIQQMQAPDGSAPQFMVLSEITRRKRMQDDMMAQQAKQGGATVAEEVIAAAGVPQEGLPQMASAMAPKSSIAQNTGIGALPQAPQGMYAGGPVKRMADGGKVEVRNGRRYTRMPNGMLVNEQGIPVQEQEYARDQFLNSVGSSGEMMRNALIDEAESRGRPSVGAAPDFPVQSFVDVPPTLPGAVDAPNRPIVPAIDLDLVGDASPLGGPPASPYDAVMQGVALEEMQSVPEFGPAPPRLDRRAQFEPEGDGMGLLYMPPEVDKVGAAYDIINAPDAIAGVADFFKRNVDTNFTEEDAAAYEAEQAADDAAQYTPASDAAARGLPPKEGTDWSDWLSAAYNGAVNSNPVTAITSAVNSKLFGRGDPDNMTEGDPLSAEDGNLLPPELAPGADPNAPVQPQGGSYSVSGGVGGTGGTGSGGGSGGTSSGAGQTGGYISELEAAMQRAEKTAEQDKWLALAQAGMALMASDQPTLGGAIGEAGMVGVEGFRSARDTYENVRMNLMQAINAQKMAAAKAVSGGRSSGGGAPSLDKYLKGIGDRIEDYMVDDGMGKMVPRQGSEAIVAGLMAQQDEIVSQMYGLQTSAAEPFDATQ